MNDRIGIVTGGGPTNSDRALCPIFGITAVEPTAGGDFGTMVTYTGAQATSVKLIDAVGQLRRVPLDAGFVRSARWLRKQRAVAMSDFEILGAGSTISPTYECSRSGR